MRPVARQFDLEMRAEAVGRHQLFLDLGREDVDAAQDDHVVGAARDLLHPPHRPRRAGQQAGQVAGAVADDREGLLGERGEDKLPHLAIGKDFAGHGVDDLGVEVILPDVQAVLGLDAFVGDAGAHDLGEAVDVDRMHVEGLFDLGPHGVGPGLRAEDADLKRAFARVAALFAVFVEDRERVGRRDHDGRGAEILDQLHLAGVMPPETGTTVQPSFSAP
jgi:hypothetical protein